MVHEAMHGAILTVHIQVHEAWNEVGCEWDHKCLSHKSQEWAQYSGSGEVNNILEYVLPKQLAQRRDCFRKQGGRRQPTGP